jgi:hypothetical protein
MIHIRIHEGNDIVIFSTLDANEDIIDIEVDDLNEWDMVEGHIREILDISNYPGPVEARIIKYLIQQFLSNHGEREYLAQEDTRLIKES